tara:strand:- start:666 stop:896 length:231 start_codon:yes stop_codon:yes gene_type:complete
MSNYTHEELSKAFDSVCDPEDWKAPIRASVKYATHDFDLVKEAVEYFTATTVSFETGVSDELWVVADGYRMGPAGP